MSLLAEYNRDLRGHDEGAAKSTANRHWVRMCPRSLRSCDLLIPNQELDIDKHLALPWARTPGTTLQFVDCLCCQFGVGILERLGLEPVPATIERGMNNYRLNKIGNRPTRCGDPERAATGNKLLGRIGRLRARLWPSHFNHLLRDLLH